jgi:uncharacterized membrane protein
LRAEPELLYIFFHCRISTLPVHDPATREDQGRTYVYLIAIAWIYVVLMMALAEALSSQGTLLGAAFTFLLYGLLPLSLLLYIMGTPLRRRRARREQADEPKSTVTASSLDHDDRGHPTGDTIAPERKEV